MVVYLQTICIDIFKEKMQDMHYAEFVNRYNIIFFAKSFIG